MSSLVIDPNARPLLRRFALARDYAPVFTTLVGNPKRA